jgi:hypothetical protein
MISAGLYYGQYLSQYDMRKIVSGTNQRQQLLLGYNEGYAAAQLRLKYKKMQSTGSAAFLAWIKHFLRGKLRSAVRLILFECGIPATLKP